MLSVYMNYPNSRISVHSDSSCSRIQVMHKLNQRIIKINKKNLSTELKNLKTKQLRFNSNANLNDVWIHIDLDDVSTEDSLVKTIQHILGGFYKPFASAVIEKHC